MTDLSDSSGETRPRSRLRGRVGVAIIVLVLGVAAWSLYAERGDLRNSLRELGIWPAVASFAVGLIGVALTYLEWRTVLKGLKVDLPLIEGARVYFVSQLGKYVPGSIWPLVMQMEEGRRHGASRAVMITANLFTLLLGCTVGMLCATLTLPLSSREAVRHYWWVLLALPILLAILHPRTVPLLLDRLLRVLRRAPAGLHVPAGHSLRAAGWAAASFTLLGAHLGLLVGPFAGWQPSTWLLSVGTMSLAICVGVLAIPVPAGAGVRDAVMVVSLSPTIGTTSALLVAVTSRILLSAGDLFLALLLLAIAGRRTYPPTADATPTPQGQGQE